MRRFIAYILASITMVLCLGVAFTPVFTKIKPGREYTSGEEFVYELRDATVEAEADDTYHVNDDTEVKAVAEEMKSRLDAFGIEDYSVTVEGKTSIRVNVSISDNNLLNYVRQILPFNGGHFSLATSTGEDRIDQADLIGDNKAYIVREQDVFPYLVIPVKNLDKVRTMVDNANSGEVKEEESESPNLFLWNNVTDDDNLNYTEASKDAVFTHYHLTRQFASSNFWYQKSSEEKTEIGILFGSADEENNYDTNSLEAANKAATYYLNLINAKSYSDKFKVVDLFVTESSSGVTYNTINTKASIENLLVYSSDVNLALSLTLISTLVCTIIISLILVLFYRSTALGMIANTTSSVFLTFLVFNLVMRATFSPAAMIGGVLLAVASLLGEIYYANKFREEVYKGRTLKKANTEATKKTTLISIDIAVVTAFLGLMLYLLGGSALRPMGIVLFFGAIISLVMTLVVFRLLNWLLTNTTKLQERYRFFNIDPEKVPNIMNEQKANFEGPYQDRDFTKPHKIAMIASLVLLVAGVAGIITFGVLNKSPLNVSASSADSTIVYVSIRQDNPVIQDTTTFKDKVLANVTYKEAPLSENDSVYVDYEQRVTYTAETTLSKTYNYYVVTFNGSLTDDENNALVESFENALIAVEGEDAAETIAVDARGIKSTVGTPNQGFVALATGLGIVGAALYFVFRYRPNKGVTVLLSATFSTAITYGVLALTRIPTTAITSLVMPMVALFSILSAIYFFNKEKDILDENKEELTKERRHDIMVKAIALSAGPLFVAAIVSGYIGINYFGFGPMSLAIMFAGFIVGVILSVVLNLMVVGPLSEMFAHLFGKIRLPQFKRKPRKEKIRLKAKKNSSEPEETIFIGIND